MKKIKPLDVFSWTFRRNEKDVINLYDSLSDIMRLATGGDMLNFGYWDNETSLPILAQKKLCSIFAEKAQLESGQKIVDIGSGLGAPAFEWHNAFSPIEITSVNINFDQLQYSLKQIRKLLQLELKLVKDGGPDRIRTGDLTLRKRSHYPCYATSPVESFVEFVKNVWKIILILILLFLQKANS